jgi:hypothetical protein
VTSNRRSTACSAHPFPETVFGGNFIDRDADRGECRRARILACEPPTGSWSAGRSAPAGRSRPTRTSPAKRGAVLPRDPGAHPGWNSEHRHIDGH